MSQSPDGGPPRTDTPFRGMRALQSRLVVLAGTAMEYALIAALVAIIVICVARLTGTNVSSVFTEIGSGL